jgi:hypothetical protein
VSGLGATLLLIALGSTNGSVEAQKTIWLIVGASDPSPTGIARAAKGLAVKAPRGLVFQTRDCGDQRNVFGYAVEVADSPDSAKAALQRARGLVKDAYIKRCVVVPRSLLDLRFPAVESSIADVPDDAVNWDDIDRVSTVIKLPDGRDVVAQRVFVDDPEDPLEGRTVRVILVSGPGKGTLLNDDCMRPERFKVRDGLLTFQCDGQEAGDQLLHVVLAFDKDGKQLANVDTCRNPSLPDDFTLLCGEESVDIKGRLKLRPKRTALTKAKASAQKPAH